MEEAPKDQTILANFKNQPGPCVCHWSKSVKKWAVAILQAGLFRGQWNDYYFETEYFDHEDMENWRELK